MTSWQKGALVLGAVFFVCSRVFDGLAHSRWGPTVGYRAEWAEQWQRVRGRDLPGEVRADLEAMEREAGTVRGAEVAERVAAWYADRRDWWRAAKAARKAYLWTPEDSPKLTDRAQTLGLAYRRAGRAHKAVGLYNDFVRRHPDAPKASSVGGALIETLSAIKRYEEAMQRYGRLQRKYPELESNLDALRGLRDAYVGLGHHERLRQLQKHIADVQPDSDAGRAAREYLEQLGAGRSSDKGSREAP